MEDEISLSTEVLSGEAPALYLEITDISMSPIFVPGDVLIASMEVQKVPTLINRYVVAELPENERFCRECIGIEPHSREGYRLVLLKPLNNNFPALEVHEKAVIGVVVAYVRRLG